MTSISSIPSNLHGILAHLSRLSNVPVRLVAVSKLKSVADIKLAYDANQRHFGENYVSELTEKCLQLPKDIRWHMIGHLQSNKVTKLISGCPNLFMIETVDSVKLASKLEIAMRTYRNADRLKVLVEVKTSGEDSKDGIAISEVSSLIIHIRDSCPHLQFSGLMTIADPKNCEGSFKELVYLRESLERDGLGIEIMSMGMSGDYELAIRSGSTQVRIGSSIFGSR